MKTWKKGRTIHRVVLPGGQRARPYWERLLCLSENQMPRAESLVTAKEKRVTVFPLKWSHLERYSQAVSCLAVSCSPGGRKDPRSQ